MALAAFNANPKLGRLEPLNIIRQLTTSRKLNSRRRQLRNIRHVGFFHDLLFDQLTGIRRTEES
jgi:hypothetical protein